MNYERTGQSNRYRRQTMRQVFPDTCGRKPEYAVPTMEIPDGNTQSCEGNNGCRKSRWAVYGNPLGSVYAPYQVWRNLYGDDKALSRGTLFSELDLPFEGANHRNGGKCLL